MRDRPLAKLANSTMATLRARNPLPRVFARVRGGPVWLVFVLIVYVFLGARFIRAVPLFETPNEPWHFGYVRWLIDQRTLPPLTDSGDAWDLGQAHQPPLYYAIGALFTGHIDTGPLEDVYVRNPHAALGRPNSFGNKNAVLATATLNPHYPDIVRALYMLRGLCLGLSVLTVLLTYLMASTLAPGYHALAVLAAALVAFNPQFLFVASSATNDALSIMLATLTLYLSVRVCCGSVHRWRTPIFLGASVGLGALTHWSGLLSLLMIPLAYVIRAIKQRDQHLWRDVVRPIAIGVGVAAALCGWWYGRNLVLYGDLMGLQSLTAAHPDGHSLAESIRALIDSVVSFWGVFGWMNVLADEVYYDMVRILLVLSSLGIALVAVRIHWSRRTLGGYRWGGALLLGLWVIMIVAALVRRTQMLGGLEGRLLFPAIAPIAFFMAMGLMGWWSRYHATRLAIVPCALLCIVSFFVPSCYIVPAYAQPFVTDLTLAPPEMQPLDIAYGDEFFLLGYDLRSANVAPGEDVELDLYWLARKRMTQDYTFYVHVFGRDGERIGGVDTYPGGGGYPTRLWVPGEVVRDTYRVPISHQALAPTQGIIRVGAYDDPTRDSLFAFDLYGNSVGQSPQIATLRVASVEPPAHAPQWPLEANLGKVDLWGYDLEVAGSLGNEGTDAAEGVTASGGDVLQVTLYWNTRARMSVDYTVFVHVVSKEGSLVAQIDEQPVHGDYATHHWHVGERVQDRHHVVVPADLPPGDYSIRVGMYLLATGERLPVIGADAGETYVELGPIRVQGNDGS